MNSSTEKANSLYSRPAWLWWLLAAIIFAVGLGVRLYDLNDPPLDFHATRQLHSALIARGMYYENLPSAPAWQREMAVRRWHMEGLIEPPVMERLTAWAYQLAGGEDLRIPRLFSIVFWMIGAVFLIWLAIEMVGRDGALMAAFLFLIWPYGVTASRSFQPDPLMVALIAAAVWAGDHWERRHTWGWAAAAGLLAGAAIYIKSVAVFFVGPALAALVIWGPGLRCGVRDRQVWVIGMLAVIPYAVYLVDGLYISRFLVDQFSDRFLPELWRDPAFYLRWVSNLGRVFPFELCVGSAVGALLLRRPAHRAVLLGMWMGYLAFGMALPHLISTHDYYHLPLFVLVALGLAAVAETVLGALRGPAWLARLAAVTALAAVVVMVGYQARNILKRNDYSTLAQTWTDVGELVGPDASVVALTDDYGGGLSFWGWLAPVTWPTADDIRFQSGEGQKAGFEARFAELAEGRSFFVISPLDELARQPELEQYLMEHYPVLRAAPDLLVYDLRAPLKDQP